MIVAPYTGAWIETTLLAAPVTSRRSRTLYGCVDWNTQDIIGEADIIGRTLYGCVDWNNWEATSNAWPGQVAPYTGAWIETEVTIRAYNATKGRTLYGCVDWNSASMIRKPRIVVAPYTGAWIGTTTPIAA